VIIRQLRGGLTNDSYLIEVSGVFFVLRINADNSDQLGIDRRQEIQAMARAGDSHLAPAIIYVDHEIGFLVTEYIEGRVWNEGDLDSANNILKLSTLLNSIHGLEPIETSVFIAEKIRDYKNEIGAIIPGLDEIEKAMEDFVDEAITDISCFCLCHNDLLVSNIVETLSGDLIVLDWEYAAMGHPLFDLAAVIEGQKIAKLASDNLLSHYQAAYSDPSSADYRRFLQWRVIYCYVDLLWYALHLEHERKLIAKKILYLNELLTNFDRTMTIESGFD